LSLNPQVTDISRTLETPDGKTLIAALDPGLVALMPQSASLVLTLHFSGKSLANGSPLFSMAWAW